MTDEGRLLPEVLERDLDRGGDRDRHQRAEHPEQVRADEDRGDHRERVQVDRAAVDERLQHAVLELLVDDDEGDPDERVPGEVGEQRHQRDEHAADRRADERDQVEERHQHRERDGERHVEDAEEDVGREPGRGRERQRAGHVAAGRAVDVGGHLAHARLVLGAHLGEQEVHDPPAVEQQEERDGQHRHELQDGREDADGDGLQRARGVAEPARQARGLLLELLRDVVLVVVLAQRVVGADVVDVARGRRRRTPRPR